MFERAGRTLIWWNLGIAVSLIAAVVLAMFFTISGNIEQEVARDLNDNATSILRTVRYVSPNAPGAGSLTPAPIYHGSEHDEDKEHAGQTEYEGEDGKLVADRDVSISLSEVFYYVMDTNGSVLENSRQYSSKSLPDLSVLSQVLTGQSLFREVKLDGGVTVRLYSVPIRLEDGRVVGMLQVRKDLNSYRGMLNSVLITTGLVSLAGLVLALVAALLLTRRALVPVRLALDRQREFVADASHELRTPLTLIRANAEVALRNKNKTVGESAELLEDIRQETDYLTRLVTDLLTLARSDMGKLEYKPEPVELQLLVKEVASDLKPLAEARNLSLQYEDENSGELWVHGDPLRLRQLLVILVDNAIKYTQEGSIKLSVSHGRGQNAVIKVSDTGIGIPHDKLDMIFERFYRIDKARARNEGGFGLGLAIAQWVAQVHGGSIHATSQVGHGSTFTVTLPTHHSHKK